MSESLREASNEELEILKPFLDEMVTKNEQTAFIKDDPISFMYAFENRENRVLAGFFAALMAWGRRSVILDKTEALLERMNFKPNSFIRQFKDSDRQKLEGWKHRTFKPVDIYWLVKSLQKILKEHENFETFWELCYQSAQNSDADLLTVFHKKFFSYYPQIPKRTYKHIAQPAKGSACKRLCMFLRWMIRKNSSVDAGIMNFMPASELFLPLDVHAARQARILGLLSRRQNDWKAVRQVTQNLKLLNPEDPVKYDYALFGLGVNSEVISEKYVVNSQCLEAKK